MDLEHDDFRRTLELVAANAEAQRPRSIVVGVRETLDAWLDGQTG